MEEVKLTPNELKEAIDFGKLIGSGFFSKVFTYKGRLIKMDQNLYDLLKVNNPVFSDVIVKDHYKWQKEDFNNREQLEELSKRQPFIRPRVPEGIITINSNDSRIKDVSPGIIIPYFEGYENLKKIPATEYKQLLILLRKVLDDIKNLADNEIAQEDLFHYAQNDDSANPELYDYNSLQKNGDAQIIDMSGPLVKVGKNFEGAKVMYSDFAKMMNYYYIANGLKPIYNETDNLSEDDLSRMITEFDKATRK